MLGDVQPLQRERERERQRKRACDGGGAGLAGGAALVLTYRFSGHDAAQTELPRLRRTDGAAATPPTTTSEENFNTKKNEMKKLLLSGSSGLHHIPRRVRNHTLRRAVIKHQVLVHCHEEAVRAIALHHRKQLGQLT